MIFYWFLFHYLMSINYQSIYWNKVSMISPIIHNSNVWRGWIHKSQVWLHMTTWFAYKIGFYKICKSKTCHFWKIMQITPYSISKNYKLSNGSSITFFRCSPIIWKPHQCVHDMLNTSLCLWIWTIRVMD